MRMQQLEAQFAAMQQSQTDMGLAMQRMADDNTTKFGTIMTQLQADQAERKKTSAALLEIERFMRGMSTRSQPGEEPALKEARTSRTG